MSNYEERDTHIRACIKSNLIGFGLPSETIDSITDNCTNDILILLKEFDLGSESKGVGLCG